MEIRISAKALIVHDGMLLLNRCARPRKKPYYALPGGGQRLHESLEEAVRRECMEETGYSVCVNGLAAHFEMMFTDLQLGQKLHKHYFVFHCGLESEERVMPAELDLYQQTSQWIDLRRARSLPLRPLTLHTHFERILRAKTPLHLEFVRISPHNPLEAQP